MPARLTESDEADPFSARKEIYALVNFSPTARKILGSRAIFLSSHRSLAIRTYLGRQANTMCVDAAVRDIRTAAEILDQAGRANLDINSSVQTAGAMPNPMPEAVQRRIEGR